MASAWVNRDRGQLVSGFHLPAEWKAQDAVWVAPPHNRETWPGCFEQASDQFQAFIDQLRRYTPVRSLGDLGVATNDSWIRDFGPVFVCGRHAGTEARRREGAEFGRHAGTQARRHEGAEFGWGGSAQGPGGGEGIWNPEENVAVHDQPPSCLRAAVSSCLLAHDFPFNMWGGKYEPRLLDDAVSGRIGGALGCAVDRHRIVLEGGAIEGNGQGTLMSTRQCLVNENRNPDWTREQIERELREALGIRHFIWLDGAMAGDDTDGHIDNLARFVGPRTVVAVRAPADHPDHELTQRNFARLHASTQEQGERLEIIGLPAPRPMTYDYPPDRFGPGGRLPLPASYANFLISNQALFLPTFGQPTDAQAQSILERAMPNHEVIPIRSEHLVVGLGGLHCLTMQQPAPPWGKSPEPPALTADWGKTQ